MGEGGFIGYLGRLFCKNKESGTRTFHFVSTKFGEKRMILKRDLQGVHPSL